MRIILSVLVITFLTQSMAQELHACTGYTYGDEFKGKPILSNEIQRDYATRIGLETNQFSSKTSDANDLINYQEKMPLPSNMKYNKSGLIVPSIGGRMVSDLKGRYIDKQLAAVGYKDMSSLSAAWKKFAAEYEANFQPPAVHGYDHIPEF